VRKRRGSGEGSIYEIKATGRWCAAVTLQTPLGRRRKWLYGKTRREVQDKLTVALRTTQLGLPQSDDRTTVGAYLTEWLATTAATIRPRTFVRYSEYVRIHAIPIVGHIALSHLGPQHLQQLYANRLQAGLAPTSVAHLHTVMHTALARAEAWGLIPRNVARLVRPPRAPRREMTALTPDQVGSLLSAARGDRLEALYVVAVTTGMRQGELLALRWASVDLAAATVTVHSTLVEKTGGFDFAEPKSARSRRQIALTAIAVAAVRRHRAAQLAERLRAGTSWTDHDLVFASDAGGPLNGSNILQRSFYPLLRRAGLPRVRFHDLRHSAATLMLSRSVPLKIVSEILGHSQISITADTYMHVTPGMQREAAAAVDAALGDRANR
jgi:integrase